MDEMKREAQGLSFEDFKNQNGMTFWWASEVCLMLGYRDLKSFEPVLRRTERALLSLGADIHDNIRAHERGDGGAPSRDYKMSRFACYLASMNGDPSKREVAAMQAYFAVQTRLFESQRGQVERLMIRDEICDGNKSLSAAAKDSGVQDYARFHNAGYIGMYNMMHGELARRRGVDAKRLFDTMGRTELAANLFRITQTEERVKSRGVRGQYALEETHRSVGKEVRDMVERNTGMPPEQLPQDAALPTVRRTINDGGKRLRRLDE